MLYYKSLHKEIIKFKSSIEILFLNQKNNVKNNVTRETSTIYQRNFANLLTIKHCEALMKKIFLLLINNIKNISWEIIYIQIIKIC